MPTGCTQVEGMPCKRWDVSLSGCAQLVPFSGGPPLTCHCRTLVSSEHNCSQVNSEFATASCSRCSLMRQLSRNKFRPAEPTAEPTVDWAAGCRVRSLPSDLTSAAREAWDQGRLRGAGCVSGEGAHMHVCAHTGRPGASTAPLPLPSPRPCLGLALIYSVCF